MRHKTFVRSMLRPSSTVRAGKSARQVKTDRGRSGKASSYSLNEQQIVVEQHIVFVQVDTAVWRRPRMAYCMSKNTCIHGQGWSGAVRSSARVVRGDLTEILNQKIGRASCRERV